VSLHPGGTKVATSNQAARITALNGFSSGVSGSLETSLTGDGNSAVAATVTATYVRQLPSFDGMPSNLYPASTAAAEIAGGTPGCVFAMGKSGSGVTRSGGVKATMTGCGVESNVALPRRAGLCCPPKS
jgi:hypothetical protein